MDFYADDAVLVVRPGQVTRGKWRIRRTFQAIAKHFGNALSVGQGAAMVPEGDGTALVVMETLLHVGDAAEPVTRRATYVFRRYDACGWLSTIDNSYGTDLLGAA